MDRIACEKTGYDVLNLGQNGREIPRRERDIESAEKLLKGQNADLLIVMLGSNDLLLGADARTAALRMETFLGELDIERQNLLLVAPPPMKIGEWVMEEQVIQESLALSREYRIISEKLGIRFADAGEWEVSIGYDGVHFSERGHMTFAEKLSVLIS